MKRKFNLEKLKKLHVLSSVELSCLKGGKNSKSINNNGNINSSPSGSCPPDYDE